MNKVCYLFFLINAAAVQFDIKGDGIGEFLQRLLNTAVSAQKYQKHEPLEGATICESIKM